MTVEKLVEFVSAHPWEFGPTLHLNAAVNHNRRYRPDVVLANSLLVRCKIPSQVSLGELAARTLAHLNRCQDLAAQGTISSENLYPVGHYTR